jgi:pimeloyl-ACP methyl ester carboxylesterase
MHYKAYISALMGLLCMGSSDSLNSKYPPSYETLQKSSLIKNLKKNELIRKFVITSAGQIAYFETPGKDIGTNQIPLFMIHGNSCSKEYMIKQIDGLGKQFKIIAIDLPGHGESSNAVNPELTYSMPGYAQVIAEVIKKLGYEKVFFLGWSLGGHIAFDFMHQFPQLLSGVIVACAPPFELSDQGLKEAYLPTYSTPLGSKQEAFTREDVKAYITQGGINLDQYPFLIAASMRTDSNARYYMVNSVMNGIGANERQVVETSSVPLGIILGTQEHAINNEYVRSLAYANLIMIETLEGGHDCQWSHSEDFNEIVRKFVNKITQNNAQ